MEASGESLIYISRDTVVLSQCHDEVPDHPPHGKAHRLSCSDEATECN